MHCTNPGTGQHGNCGFRDHWHIQHHPVAFFNPVLFQDIGKTAGFIIKLVKRNNLVTGRMIPFPDNRRFIRMLLKMAIQTVGTDIELAICKPFNFKIVFIKTGIFNLGKRFDPVQALCLFSPELIRLFNGLLITLKILCISGTCGFLEFCWYWIDFFHCSLP